MIGSGDFQTNRQLFLTYIDGQRQLIVGRVGVVGRKVEAGAGQIDVLFVAVRYIGVVFGLHGLRQIKRYRELLILVHILRRARRHTLAVYSQTHAAQIKRVVFRRNVQRYRDCLRNKFHGDMGGIVVFVGFKVSVNVQSIPAAVDRYFFAVHVHGSGFDLITLENVAAERTDIILSLREEAGCQSLSVGHARVAGLELFDQRGRLVLVRLVQEKRTFAGDPVKLDIILFRGSKFRRNGNGVDFAVGLRVLVPIRCGDGPRSIAEAGTVNRIRVAARFRTGLRLIVTDIQAGQFIARIGQDFHGKFRGIGAIAQGNRVARLITGEAVFIAAIGIHGHIAHIVLIGIGNNDPIDVVFRLFFFFRDESEGEVNPRAVAGSHSSGQTLARERSAFRRSVTVCHDSPVSRQIPATLSYSR